MEYLTQKNFLSVTELDFFKQVIIYHNVVHSFNWFLSNNVADESDNNDYYFVHTFFDNRTVTTSPELWSMFRILIDKLDVKAMMRGKVNLYPRTNQIIEHGPHKDLPFTHKGAVFYLNSNDGYTKLEDGTKIESIENQVLFFDPSTFHNSTTCTDAKYRITIAINYF